MSPRPSSTRAVFADTSAFFALAARTDRHHIEAQALLERVAAERRLLYTTNFVLAETHALLLHRLKPARGEPYARATALHTVQRLYQGATQLGTLVYVTLADEARAFALLAQFSDKDFTFTDATSFAVMARLGLTLSWSYDQGFVRAGFSHFA